ncbi:MAG: class I SAM-dependent methyltransferase [Zoogloea sp.]|nr:class I SAM-dependent methyltransferase [Zoogloea sp.]
MSKDHFAHKASSFDTNQSRVDNVENIANSILEAVRLDKTMHIMDFGSGTGLLSERIAPHVGKITAVDTSKSMNAQLEEKRGRLGCELEILQVDLEESDIATEFDGVVSSMTLHHIRDIPSIFRKLYSMLGDGGFIALADLDTEDGSFHSEDTGVFHCGFDRAEIMDIAMKAGFRNVGISSASAVLKPQGRFPVFLLTGVR